VKKREKGKLYERKKGDVIPIRKRKTRHRRIWKAGVGQDTCEWIALGRGEKKGVT